MNRREFLIDFGLGASGALAWCGSNQTIAAGKTLTERSIEPPLQMTNEPLQRTYRAAAIGSTGHGNFGHGLDKVFVNLPNVEFVAIADDNPEGLHAAGERNGVTRLYPDYKTMLRKEKLDVVSVAMRHSELHEEIVIACAEAGKHIFCEKPVAPDLASADRMLAACKKHGVKLAVAVQNRVSPAVLQAK